MRRPAAATAPRSRPWRAIGGPTLTALAAAATLSCATAGPVEFVTARGDKLYEGETELRFLSFNIPNLHYVEDDLRFAQAMPFRWPDEYEIEDALETVRRMGGAVVRTYALSVRKADDPAGMPRHVLGPGEFDEAGFRALDTVLAVAAAKGIRVIIPLVDNWHWWGGVAEYAAFRGLPRDAFWSDPRLREDFKHTIRFLVTRVNSRTGVAYRDDPTILAWETGNELNGPHAWTSEIAAFLQQLDPNHLVVDGRQEEVLEPRSIADPNIDFVQTHHYEKDPRRMIRHIRRSAALARGRKPYHVGEFGFLSTAGMTAVMDTIVEEGVSGGLVWSLRFHNRDGGFYWHQEPHGGDLFKAYHWPGFSSGEAYDETRFLRQMRRRAFAIRGLEEPAIEKPSAPVLVEATAGGLLTWRGSAGAGGYDIERRQWVNGRRRGPWRPIARGVSDAAVQYQPLFSDETAAIGGEYSYRVIARNEGGASKPSPPFGPVRITHRTLVDELWNGGRVFLQQGALELRRDQARRHREDAHGLERADGADGAAALYRADGEITGGRVYALVEAGSPGLGFAVSADGDRFEVYEPRLETLDAADAGTYGYKTPHLYRLAAVPAGTRFLRLDFAGAALRVARVEIEYRE